MARAGRCSIPRIAAAIYPRAFLGAVAAGRRALCAGRRTSFVDDLVAGVVQRGYPLMRAHFPRCFVDVNREPYELDPRMFDGRLPSFANTRSMRVAGGLGTVARVVGDAQEIYDQRMPVDDALRRIESLYKPYHRALRRLFTKCTAISAPPCWSTATRCPRPPATRTNGRGRNSCWATATAPVASASYRETVEKTLRDAGLRASAATSPMPAASSPSITAIPAAGLHAIQLEINRALYMDERRYRALGRLRRRWRLTW